MPPVPRSVLVAAMLVAGVSLLSSCGSGERDRSAAGGYEEALTGIHEASGLSEGALNEALEAPSPQEAAAQVRQWLEAVENLTRRYEELDPPPEVAAAHRQLVDLLGRIVEFYSEVAKRLDEVNSLAEVEALNRDIARFVWRPEHQETLRDFVLALEAADIDPKDALFPGVGGSETTAEELSESSRGPRPVSLALRARSGSSAGMVDVYLAENALTLDVSAQLLPEVGAGEELVLWIRTADRLGTPLAMITAEDGVADIAVDLPSKYAPFVFGARHIAISRSSRSKLAAAIRRAQGKGGLVPYVGATAADGYIPRGALDRAARAGRLFDSARKAPTPSITPPAGTPGYRNSSANPASLS